jgi:predicted RND superfamily exporter protein
LIFLPAVMSLLKTDVHPRLARKIASGSHDNFAKAMVLLGSFTLNRSKYIVAGAAVVAIFGIAAASKIIVNEDRIATFHPSEYLYIADKEINHRFDGTNYLDIVIETNKEEAIFDPAVLLKTRPCKPLPRHCPPFRDQLQ